MLQVPGLYAAADDVPRESLADGGLGIARAAYGDDHQGIVIYLVLEAQIRLARGDAAPGPQPSR